MAFLSVTRLRLRSWRFLPVFVLWATKTRSQAQRAPGNLGLKLLRDTGLTFWTMTAWKDEAAMRAYMLSGAHKAAMPKLANWCDEAAVTHWQQDDAALPGWQEAHRRLQATPKSSRIRHPSPDHEAKVIRAPVAN